MDAEALSTFVAIHRLGGFSAAAHALGRSQPAISRRVALLEAELGVPLFDRVGGGVVVSQAGQVLLPYAERVLAAIADAAAAVRALADEDSGPVALAVVGTLAGGELTRALRAFAATHPGVALSLRTATSAQVSDLVRRGEAGIGLRYHLDPVADLACETIADEALVVVAAPDHPCAGRRVKSLAALRGERWLAFPDRGEIAAAHIFALFLSQGLGEIDWMAVDSLTAQKRLAEAGFGLALTPLSGVADELAAGTLARIAVDGLTASQLVVAVTRRQGYLSHAARSLLAVLRTSFAPAEHGVGAGSL